MSTCRHSSLWKCANFPTRVQISRLVLWGAGLGCPAHSPGNLSSPCTRVLRRAIHFFLLPKRFLREPITMLAFPLGALLADDDDREATASSQSCTESVELGPLITPLVPKKMTAACNPSRKIVTQKEIMGCMTFRNQSTNNLPLSCVCNCVCLVVLYISIVLQLFISTSIKKL